MILDRHEFGVLTVVFSFIGLRNAVGADLFWTRWGRASRDFRDFDCFREELFLCAFADSTLKQQGRRKPLSLFASEFGIGLKFERRIA